MQCHIRWENVLISVYHALKTGAGQDWVLLTETYVRSKLNKRMLSITLKA